ncbi:uncharacterized protein LOC129399687 [Sorex araneus]|uniref:uncharacterized protein LOC129399687 n=1 Tax=Sorex araneus TaxID=42254 RepID=UPI0024335C63|nr:uncharacterized protein LOC129399687 [Sorex araneus]
MSNCATLSGGVSSSGETSLETEVKAECRGAAECPVGPYKNISVEFEVSSSNCEHLIQRLHGDQFTGLSHHSSGKRKDPEQVEIALGPAHTESKQKSDWKHGSVEGPGEAAMERMTRGESNKTAWDSAPGSPPGMVQKHFIQTHAESSLSPESANHLLNTLSVGPRDEVAPHTHLGSGVCCGLRTHADGVGGNTWFDQLPSPVLDGISIQTPQGINREITFEQKEMAFFSNHSISKDTSKMSLTESFPAQNVGASHSWNDETPPQPEQESSVLETYFYYLHMLNKIRGVSSEEKNSSLPFQGHSISKSEPVITSPKGKGRSNGMKMDRGAKAWRQGDENDIAMEGKEDTCHQGQDVMQEAALEKAKPRTLQGSYGVHRFRRIPVSSTFWKSLKR